MSDAPLPNRPSGNRASRGGPPPPMRIWPAADESSEQFDAPLSDAMNDDALSAFDDAAAGLDQDATSTTGQQRSATEYARHDDMRQATARDTVTRSENPNRQSSPSLQDQRPNVVLRIPPLDAEPEPLYSDEWTESPVELLSDVVDRAEASESVTGSAEDAVTAVEPDESSRRRWMVPTHAEFVRLSRDLDESAASVCSDERDTAAPQDALSATAAARGNDIAKATNAPAATAGEAVDSDRADNSSVPSFAAQWQHLTATHCETVRLQEVDDVVELGVENEVAASTAANLIDVGTLKVNARRDTQPVRRSDSRRNSDTGAAQSFGTSQSINKEKLRHLTELAMPLRSAVLKRTIRPKSALALRAIWQSLVHDPMFDAPRSVVMTASQSVQGVSTMTAALAMIGAEMERGKRIAILETCSHGRSIAETFGIECRSGLTELLRGRAELDEAATRLYFPLGGDRRGAFDLIGFGDRSVEQSKLPFARRWPTVWASLNSRYDHILIDAPPVASGSISLRLAERASATVLIVRRDACDLRGLAGTRRRLEQVGCPRITAILNEG